MKTVWIEPVAKPKSFGDVTFTAEEWAAASKRGALEVPYVTAIENIRASGGLYRIRPDENKPVAGVTPVLDIANAERAQLITMAHTFGVRIAKPNIPTDKLRELIASRYAKVMAADADDGDEDEGGEGTGGE